MGRAEKGNWFMAVDEKTASKSRFDVRSYLEEALDFYKSLSVLLDEQTQAIKEDDLARLCGVVLRKEKLLERVALLEGAMRSISDPMKGPPGRGFKVDKEERLIAREAASVLAKIMDAEKEAIEILNFRLEETKKELKRLVGEEQSLRNYACVRPTGPIFLDVLR